MQHAIQAMQAMQAMQAARSNTLILLLVVIPLLLGVITVERTDCAILKLPERQDQKS
jgi:hypothetical protein